MGTSGTYSFSVTRDDIITLAMKMIGKLGEYETPSAQDVSDCSIILNMMVKQRQGTADYSPGLKVWTRRRGHLFLSSSAYKYTVGPNGTGWTENYTRTTLSATTASGSPVLIVASATGFATSYNVGVQLDSGDMFWSTVLTAVGTTITLNDNLPSQASANAYVYVYQTTAQQPIVIEAAVLRDAQNEDTPINIIRDVRSYDMLPSKTDPNFLSDPTSIYYEFQLGNSFLYTDVAGAQDVSKHLVLTYMEAIQDFNNPTDNPEYPQEYYLDLSWSLARQIAPIFNMPWSRSQENNFQQATAFAKNKDAEISEVYFQSGE